MIEAPSGSADFCVATERQRAASEPGAGRPPLANQLPVPGRRAKLRAAEVNLHIVDAMIAEAAPHLAALQEQAAAYARYYQVERELRDLLLLHYALTHAQTVPSSIHSSTRIRCARALGYARSPLGRQPRACDRRPDRPPSPARPQVRVQRPSDVVATDSRAGERRCAVWSRPRARLGRLARQGAEPCDEGDARSQAHRSWDAGAGRGQPPAPPDTRAAGPVAVVAGPRHA